MPLGNSTQLSHVVVPDIPLIVIQPLVSAVYVDFLEYARHAEKSRSVTGWLSFQVPVGPIASALIVWKPAVS